MQLVLFYIYMLCILSSAIAAILLRKELKTRKISILTFFLPFVFLMELSIRLLGTRINGDMNHLIYNLYRPISVLTFAILYYQLPLMKDLRKTIIIIAVVYFLTVIVCTLFFIPIFELSSVLTLCRGLAITSFAVLFLFKYFYIDDRKAELFWKPLIWITAGVAFFYPVVSISIALSDYLAEGGTTFFGYKLYRVIPQLMSIFMYSCFTYSFYLCQKTN